MDPEVATGRRLVLAVIVVSLTFELLPTVTFNINWGQTRLPQQIVRFLLTVVLCVFLYRRANWARWVMGVLLVFGGLGSLIAGIALPPNRH